MSKKDQIAAIAKAADVTNQVAERCYNALTATLAEEIKAGKAELHSIGTFKAVQRAARTGRNPRTGDKLEIPASVKVSFSTSKGLKNAVN